MQFQMTNNTDFIANISERQHFKKMPHTTKHRTRQQKHPKQLPFVISYRSLASERHPLRNEDSILIDNVGGLFAVFDGVGGSAAADIASQTAAHAATRAWRELLTKNHRRRVYTPLQDCDSNDVCNMLEQLVLESNNQIRTSGARRAGTDDLTTTVALAALCRQSETRDYTLVYAHVGDSRVYLLRGEEGLQRLTHDDGLLTHLVKNQIVNEQHAWRIDQAMHADQLSDIEYSYFRFRGRITQALGSDTPPTIHTDKITVHPGDRILLCTDGIHDNLTDQEIEELIRNTPRTSVARVIVDRARQRSREDQTKTIRSKPDDMSAIVITCRF